jgi:uncharacterized phage infection (PIP) family protein YhgE
MELKRYQDNVIPELEKQCQTLKSELENQGQSISLPSLDLVALPLLNSLDRSANATRSEHESQFEQQIKDYQNNISQAARDTEQVRAELKKIQEESLQKENESKKLMDQLQQKYDQLQADLKDRGRFIFETRPLTILSPSVELKASSTLSERESQYEQQIKDYQNNISQAARDTEQVRTELKQSQEQSVQKENDSKKLIDQLQQKYDQLQADLKDRGRFIFETRSSAILSLPS